jgi:hypothetical protein
MKVDWRPGRGVELSFFQTIKDLLGRIVSLANQL